MKWVIAVARNGGRVGYYTGRRSPDDLPLLAQSASSRGTLAYAFEMAAFRDLQIARRVLRGAFLSIEVQP